MASSKKAKQIFSPRQKASLMTGTDPWSTVRLKKGREEVPSVRMSDGPCGIRKTERVDLDEATVKATLFPAPCLMACSWNKKAMASLGQAMAKEANDQNIDVILAPGVNIKRNPLCGRNFEYLSEDPLLSGKMGAAFIKGAQREGVGTCLKHFAGNNQEFRRFTYSAEIDERALRDLYLVPFEIAIKEADPYMIMPAYNKLNGTYCCENSFLLQKVLREEWKYHGVTVSDWGAVNHVLNSHINGLDLEMPGPKPSRPKYLAHAYKSGKFPKKTFDDSFARLVSLSNRCKPRRERKDPAYDYGESHELAIELASESIVLAKNDDHILPLKSFDDICVIGGLAKEPLYQGKGSSHVNARNPMNFLEAAPRYLKKKVKIPYAQGYTMKPGEIAEDLRFEAMDLAGQHETVILFLGQDESHWAEGYDRSNMRLSDEQYQLFDTVYKQNQNIIVVISTGAPVELPFLYQAKAVILAYMPGEAFGESLSSLIAGERNFSGKLAETWPVRYMDVPSASFYPGSGDLSLYKESIFVGYRYYLTGKKRMAFPFGHGLSYTTFKYSGINISRKTLSDGEFVEVSFTLKNTGHRAGAEVVECYIEPVEPVVMKAKRTLCHFGKVSLEPGESTEVKFTIEYKNFAHFDAPSQSNQVEGGKYLIEVGSSAEEILLEAEINVKSVYEAKNQRFIMPNYYKMGKPGFNASDEEFNTLRKLSPSLHVQKKKKRRNYKIGWNSTIGEIKETLIGRHIVKIYEKQYISKDLDEAARKVELDCFLAMPLRNVTMATSEKTGAFILALANREYSRAPFAYLFDKRK